MKRILCVDDNLTLLRLYHDEFSEEGYEVVLAKNGQEAISKFDKWKPDVVVMDLRLPGMDGIEVLNAILGKDRQASIIIHTAFPQYRQNFMTWGAEAYLIKSSDLGELKRKVREVFNNRSRAKWPKAADREPVHSLTP